MNHDADDHDDVLCVLYARALQRRGQGFPSTDEEIRDFEASCDVSSEERERFMRKLGGLLDRAFAGAEANAAGTGPGPDIHALPFDQPTPLSYAARAARGEKLSDGLEAEIKRLIDEDEEDGADDARQ